MKLQFVGVGGAFTDEYFQSNMVLQVGDERMLIDCGSDARRSLRAAGIGYRDLQAVYISHLHADHAGGMEWLALKTRFDPGFVDADGKPRKLRLYMRSSLQSALWEQLRTGCGLPNERTSLKSFFDTRFCGRNKSFEFAGVSFKTVQTVHYSNDAEIVPSFGLFWTAPNGQKIFLSTDTQFIMQPIMSFCKAADVIFHDCETSAFRTGVHAHYDDLKTLDPALKRRMWLYHYQDGALPDAKADGFAGFVHQGQVFDFS